MLDGNMMLLYTKIIPAILIFLLVFFNVRKMQKRAAAMRQEHSCGGSCAGCAQHSACHGAKSADCGQKKDADSPQ